MIRVLFLAALGTVVAGMSAPKAFAAPSGRTSEVQKAETASQPAAPVAFPDVKALMAEVLPPPGKEMPMADIIARVSHPDYFRLGTRHFPPDDPVHRLFLADNPQDADLFRPLLESRNEALKGAACLYFGRIQDAASFDQIVECTWNENSNIRRLAVEALGSMGRPEAVPHLVGLIDDPEGEVRDSLPRALHSIPGPEATHALLKVLEKTDRSYKRSIVLGYLRKRGDQSVVPGLIAALGNIKEEGDVLELLRTLRDLSGHDIKGDYRDPAGRQRLMKQWAEWWTEHGAHADPVQRGRREPESMYNGSGVIITSAEHQYLDNLVHIQPETAATRDRMPLLVPVDDKPVDDFVQCIIYQKGREVRREDIAADQSWSRYGIIPFGSIARGLIVQPMAFAPSVPPGDYEVQIEVRSLCTELTYLDRANSCWGSGACDTKAEIFTVRSNRMPLSIHAPMALSAESMNELARIMADPEAKPQNLTLTYEAERGEVASERANVNDAYHAARILRSADAPAMPAVLAQFKPEDATSAQLDFLFFRDEPRAKASLEQAAAAGNEKAQALVKRREKPQSLSELVATATREIGSQGWSWSESRQALEALDGRLGPEHTEYAPLLAAELGQRLTSQRDRHAGRPGESLWGAFRTAFFLGRIGDPASAPVLRRAATAATPDNDWWLSKNQCIFLRWYAGAALKLIDVQSMPEEQRAEEVKKWIRHCFSSPEEHYMARARLLPYLSQMLGGEREKSFATLAPKLKDPWMAADARRFAEQAQ